MPQAITKSEAAALESRSESWIEKNIKPSRILGQACNGQAIPGYDISALSAAAQDAWARQRKVIELAPLQSAGQMALALTQVQGPNLSDEDRAEAERRFSAIEPLIIPAKYPLLWTEHRQSKLAVIAYLATQHQVKPRTLYSWLSRWKKGGLPALVAKDRADKGHPRIFNNAALDFILAAALPKKGAYGCLTVAEIYRAYTEERDWRAAHATHIFDNTSGEFEARKYKRYLDGSGRLSPQAQLPDASYETFRSWFTRIPEVVKVMQRDGEEAFHNSQEILSFRDLTDIRPLDYVVMDHRRLDIFCLLRDRAGKGWKLGRPWLTASIDMRTRKWLAWVIVENPSSDSIAAVLKRTFLDWGLPVSLYWDNGKDFTCEWFEGKKPRTRTEPKVGEMSTAWRGVLETVGVRVTHAIVKRARSKIIEPNFVNVANFDKTLPWYCGHKPTARPERFAALVQQHERWMAEEADDPAFPTIEQVAATYNEALATLNEREHTGEGMQKITPTGKGWLCPNEAWERLIGGVERRSVPAEALQFCFNKRREVTVQHGEVRTTFGGRHYHYRLDAGLDLMPYNGREVQFGYDPLDLGTVALYCDNRFLGLADCVELRRMGEQAFVQDEKDRRASRREVKKFIAAVHQQVPIPDYQQRALRRQAVAPNRMEPDRSAPSGDGGVAIPASIAEAVSAGAEANKFSFAAAPSDLIGRADRNAYRDDDDATFRFFENEEPGELTK